MVLVKLKYNLIILSFQPKNRQHISNNCLKVTIFLLQLFLFRLMFKKLSAAKIADNENNT